ncbi:MAG: metallophosphoesterase [Thermoplasmata archaeon]
MRKVLGILFMLILTLSVIPTAGFNDSDIHFTSNRGSTNVVLEIHKIRQIDEVDPSTSADWYYLVEFSDDGGLTWTSQASSEPLANSEDVMIVENTHTFTSSSDEVLFRISLMEDDGDTGDDSADISAQFGGGIDDSVPPPEGGVFHGIFWLNNHTVGGDPTITNEIGWHKTSGEWDGSTGTDENDAELAFNIYEEGCPNILKPIFTIPKIQEKGKSLLIKAESTTATATSNWSAQIWRYYGTYMESYDLLLNGVTDKGDGIWVVNFSIPFSAREELYNITVSNDFGSDMEYHAVKAVDELDSEFKFLQMSDVHIGSTSNDGATTYFEQAIKETNLINPDFLIITGDVCDKQYWTFSQDPARIEQSQVFRSMLMELNVPVYVASGNHDWSYDDTSDNRQNILDYKRWVNPYWNYSFDYGDFHFSMVNSGKYVGLTNADGLLNSANLTWLENDLAANMGKTQRFIFMHHPSYPDRIDDDTLRDQLRQMVIDYDVSLYLAGHTHDPTVYDKYGNQQTGDIGSPDTPLHVVSSDIKEGDSYRMVRVKDSDVQTYTYDDDGDGIRSAYNDMPLGNANINFNPANDGTNNKVVATIDNGLYEYFNDAFVEFKVAPPPAGYDYIVENGTMMDMIDCGTHRIFYVDTNLQKTSTKNVTIKLSRSEDFSLDAGGENDGWRFMSVNLIPTNTDLISILEHNVYGISGSYDKVMYYDSEKGDWKTYCPGRGGHFNSLGNWDEKMGIWIHMTENSNLAVTGDEPISADIILNPGWNMVGYPSSISSNNGLPTEVDKVGYFESSAEYNLAYDHAPSNFTFTPKEGYWIHNPTSSNLTWTVNYSN